MADALDLLIAAFESRLSDIRAEHGSAWAVFHGDDVAGSFPEFAEAAEFAFSQFGEDHYLIRHTYAKPEFAPFLVVER